MRVCRDERGGSRRRGSGRGGAGGRRWRGRVGGGLDGLVLARCLFDQAGELAVVVLQESEDAEGLGIVRVLHGVMEGGGGEIVLVAGGGDTLVKCGRGSGADMLMGSGKVRRLHDANGIGGAGDMLVLCRVGGVTGTWVGPAE